MIRRGNRHVIQRAVEVGAVVVVERRDGEQSFGVESVYPGKIRESVAFMLAVTESNAGVLGREVIPRTRCVLEIVRVGVVRDLVVVLPQRGHEAQLVGRVKVEDQRAEAAVTVRSVMYDLSNGWLQAQITPVPVHAGIVGETLGVTAKAQLSVGLVEVSCA